MGCAGNFHLGDRSIIFFLFQNGEKIRGIGLNNKITKLPKLLSLFQIMIMVQ